MSQKDEKYCFNISEDGQQGLFVLDRMFNAGTQAFLLENGLAPGMRVLEIGCGIGTMSAWLADQIGDDGYLLGIDNDENQIAVSQKLAAAKALSNAEFKLLSAYDLEQLSMQFDLIYCRFVLHHLTETDSVIKAALKLLKSGGKFICEEGITSFGFTYPDSIAITAFPDDGSLPDKNIGKKLYHKMYQAGFRHLKANIQHPVLATPTEKALILPGIVESKQFYLDSGHSETEWQALYDEAERVVHDDSAMVAFYASCQVVGQK